MTVYFIGSGPGDPELMTLKGQRILDTAPLVLFAGSLIPEANMATAKERGALVLDSAPMALDAQVELMADAHAKGQHVARLHCGDPSLYGAIGEQIRRLEALGIDYEIIPGVMATSASAAWLGKELTLSGVSQTLIMTRYEGKTPFPERERLPALAATGATLAIHLGVTRIHKIVEDLLPHYGADCPVAVCYKVVGTLGDIVAKVREKKFTRTSLVLVGRVLDADNFNDSYLYDENKAHIYRKKDHNKKVG